MDGRAEALAAAIARVSECVANADYTPLGAGDDEVLLIRARTKRMEPMRWEACASNAAGVRVEVGLPNLGFVFFSRPKGPPLAPIETVARLVVSGAVVAGGSGRLSLAETRREDVWPPAAASASAFRSARSPVLRAE